MINETEINEDLVDWGDHPPIPRTYVTAGPHGWVYLIQIVAGPTKIGRTGTMNPQVRLKSIDCGVPYSTQILGLCWNENARTLEAELHSEFTSKRIKGEWFSLDAGDIQQILSRPGFGPYDDVKKGEIASMEKWALIRA